MLSSDARAGLSALHEIHLSSILSAELSLRLTWRLGPCTFQIGPCVMLASRSGTARRIHMGRAEIPAMGRSDGFALVEMGRTPSPVMQWKRAWWRKTLRRSPRTTGSARSSAPRRRTPDVGQAPAGRLIAIMHRDEHRRRTPMDLGGPRHGPVVRHGGYLRRKSAQEKPETSIGQDI